MDGLAIRIARNMHELSSCKAPGGVEEVLMAHDQLPDVCQVVHAVALLHQNLLRIPAAWALFSVFKGNHSYQHNAAVVTLWVTSWHAKYTSTDAVTGAIWESDPVWQQGAVKGMRGQSDGGRTISPNPDGIAVVTLRQAPDKCRRQHI